MITAISNNNAISCKYFILVIKNKIFLLKIVDAFFIIRKNIAIIHFFPLLLLLLFQFLLEKSYYVIKIVFQFDYDNETFIVRNYVPIKLTFWRKLLNPIMNDWSTTMVYIFMYILQVPEK